MTHSLIPVLALVASVSVLAQSVETQTDWSGGPDVFGPVEHWGDRFHIADEVAWRSIPGQVALACTPLGQPVESVIAPDADHPRTCTVGDLDGDGDTDVIIGDPIDGYPQGWIYWWERQGEGAWVRHVVDGDFYGAKHVNVADVDGDGDTDVLAAAYYGLEDHSPEGWRNGRYAWFENLAGDGSAWTQHLVREMFWGARYIDAGDLDGDGDTDIVGASELTDGVWEQEGDITWFENLAGDGTSWAQHELELEQNSAEAHVADLDGDGDLDVIGGEQERISWWENLHGDGSAWLKRYVTTELRTSAHLDLGDIDNDGDLDIMGGAYNTNALIWWENTAGDGTAWFARYVIGWPHTRMNELADIDGDGDLDAAWTSTSAAHWIENISGDGMVWSFREVTYWVELPWLALGDVNDDGRLDMVITDEDSTNIQDHQVAWHDLSQFNDYGELVSSVLDGGNAPAWAVMTWNAEVDTDATLTVQVRASNDPSDLGPFITVEGPGADLADLIDPHARYLQYRLLLSTDNPDVSPVVQEISVESAIPGDLNGDGCVDQADLGILLADWDCAGGDCPGDVDGDGDTDQADLGILLAHWGEGCP